MFRESSDLRAEEHPAVRAKDGGPAQPVRVGAPPPVGAPCIHDGGVEQAPGSAVGARGAHGKWICKMPAGRPQTILHQLLGPADLVLGLALGSTRERDV
jgi:hypothetical protein